jgi:hypothetical protein
LIGVANVESTTSASPSVLQSVATGSSSITRRSGLVGVSTKTARVFFLSPRFHLRESTGVTNDTSIPNRPNSCWNSLCVVP